MEFVSNVFTNERCIGCNKCVSTCPAVGANVYQAAEDATARIEVDRGGCIECGQCFDVCDHDARSYTDDTENFLEALAQGEEISVLVAPSLKINYPAEYSQLLATLKEMGVNRILSVAFGADICTWAYLHYLDEHSHRGMISTPCPAFVSYVEHYEPELIPFLVPVKSPVLCAATYLRKEEKLTEKFAFLGPCIAKRTEFIDPANRGLVDYNLTFQNLIPALRERGLASGNEAMELDDIMGRFYPIPGGLGENIRWYLGRKARIRDISGKENLYRWLRKNRERILRNTNPYYLVDVLNCMDGCLEGTAVEMEQSVDDAIYTSEDMHEEHLSREDELAIDAHREALEERFTRLELADYLRTFTDYSHQVHLNEPSAAEAEEIYRQLHKDTPLSRMINCSYCGYSTCREMVSAIHNGYSQIDNCIHYEKDEVVLRLAEAEKASEAKTRFLANMSHDLRTPMNAVIGFTELAQTSDADEEQVKGYLKQINTSGKQLLDIINNILELTRIENHKLTVKEELTEVETFYDGLLTVFQADAEAKDIRLTMTHDRQHAWLYIDHTIKEQIILNVVGNALKYTKEHGHINVHFRGTTDGRSRSLLDPDHRGG